MASENFSTTKQKRISRALLLDPTKRLIRIPVELEEEGGGGEGRRAGEDEQEETITNMRKCIITLPQK